MAEHALGVEVVTPEAALFAGPAVALVTATSEGDLTVMADHAELIGDVVPGVVKIENLDGEIIEILVHSGFLQVTTSAGAAKGIVDGVQDGDRTTRATILAGVAEKVNEIDVAAAQEAKADAEARIADLKSSGRNDDHEELSNGYLALAQAEADLAMAELRLATARPLAMG